MLNLFPCWCGHIEEMHTAELLNKEPYTKNDGLCGELAPDGFGCPCDFYDPMDNLKYVEKIVDERRLK